MNLLDFAESALIFKPDEPVSKVISRLFDQKRHEGLVLKNGQYMGMVVARDLAKRKINNPDKMKIEKFIYNINPVSPETPLEDVITSILVNDYKSVPIESAGNYLILTKLNILKAIKNKPTFKEKKAQDAMRTPFCISSDDSIDTAMSVLREEKISRLPVVDAQNRVAGFLDTIDLLKADTDRARSRVGEKAGEKMKLRHVLASSLMQKAVPRAKPNTPVKKVIDLMSEKNTPTVVIEEGGKLAGIVTPKLILKLLGKEVSGVYVRISGAQKEDMFIKSVIDEEIRNEIGKLGKFLPIDYMVIHVDHYKERGKREKYSIKARLISQKGMFFADSVKQTHAWDITQAMREVLNKLEKQIIRQKERRETYKRGV